MLPARFAPWLFALFMSLFMSFLMSGVLTLVNLGPVPGFVRLWLHAFGVAWVIAFPCALVVTPLVRCIVTALTRPTPGP